MAPRKRPVKEADTEPPSEHICDDCVYCEWITVWSNLDIHGNPICFKCKYQKWQMIRRRKGCLNWKPRNGR